jgi:hypothetical protein
MALLRDDVLGDVWSLESSDEALASELLTDVVGDALGGSRKAQNYLRKLWDGEPWPSIKKKLKAEGSTWYVWWMDGVRQHLRNLLN